MANSVTVALWRITNFNFFVISRDMSNCKCARIALKNNGS